MELTGRTDILPLFDLVQMLSVNEATGMLKVESAEERGYLYLQDGAVINALDTEHRDGEDAAKRVFALSDAEFTFSPDLPSVAHRIHCTTQNLMMEIARQLDEESLSEGSDGNLGDHVREVQEASEALRDIFQQLDSDSKVLSLRSHQGFALTDLVAQLDAGPHAVLHLAEGAPPSVSVGGRLTPVSELALDRRGYEELRDLMLRSAVPVGAAGGSENAWTFSAGARGRVRLERVRWPGGEVFTARRDHDDHDLGALLPWPAERLVETLVRPGSVVLVTGPERSEVAGAFSAACIPVLAGDAGPFLGLAARWSPRSKKAGSVLLSTLCEGERDAAADLVDRLDPRIVAVEDSGCPQALSAALRGLRAGARALIGVCGASPAHVAHRLLEDAGPEDRGSWMYQLGVGLVAVLGTDGTVAQVDDESRAALTAGDPAPLVAALARIPR